MATRNATAHDALPIAKLHADSWRATYRGLLADAYLDGPVFQDRREVWTDRLTHPPDDQYVVVAERGGELIGFACAYARQDETWGNFLDNIHVRPELHGRGIGKRLVADVAGWCRTAGPDIGLYLWVFAANTRARRFYESLGASDAGAELRPPGVGGEPREIHRYHWPTLDDVRIIA